MKKFSIGTISVKPGSKGHGYIEVAKRPDGSSLGFPVIIVNGASEGPTIEVDGCTHGDETEGAEAIMRFASGLDPKNLRGTFIGVPVINVPAFEARQRINPYDHEMDNMNRIFPGNDEGSVTERIAYSYFNNIVLKADYVISFHSAGWWGKVYPHVHYLARTKVSKRSLELAKAFGVEYLEPADTMGPEEHSISGTLLHAAAEKGIPAITPEVGGGDQSIKPRKRNIKICMKGITNIMKQMDMLDGEPELPERWTFVDSWWIYNKHGGICINEVDVGTIVSKGDTISRIVNPFFEEIERIRAPCDGPVLMTWVYPLVHPGGEFVSFAKILKVVPCDVASRSQKLKNVL